MVRIRDSVESLESRCLFMISRDLAHCGPIAGPSQIKNKHVTFEMPPA